MSSSYSRQNLNPKLNSNAPRKLALASSYVGVVAITLRITKIFPLYCWLLKLISLLK